MMLLLGVSSQNHLPSISHIPSVKAVAPSAATSPVISFILKQGETNLCEKKEGTASLEQEVNEVVGTSEDNGRLSRSQ
jgi:hypothetical protein